MNAASHVLQERDVAFGLVAELEWRQFGSPKPGQWAHGLQDQVKKTAILQGSMGSLKKVNNAPRLSP